MNRNVLLIAGGVVLLLTLWLVSPKQKQIHSQPVKEKSTPAVKVEQQTSDALFVQANKFFDDGEKLKAKQIYKKLINDYSDFENIDLVQKKLEDINMNLIFSNSTTPNTVMHKVSSGDTLGELAKKYGTTIELIKKNNMLNSDVIRLGQLLRIWNAEFNIYVDKSQNILILKTGDEVVKVYNVSTGAGNSTPVGEYTIETRLTDPVWFNRGVVVPPESPKNVLGSRWLGFDLPGYGIHGTVEPETIGQQVTAGCVRMRNYEVEELYSIIPRGTKVKIVD